MDTIWILGSDDAEMRQTDTLLRDCGQSVRYALVPERGGFRRVRPGEMGTTCGTHLDEIGWASEEVSMLVARADLVAVEVAGPWGDPQIDHHDKAERTSWGPDRFFQASSLGQTIERLAQMVALPAEVASRDPETALGPWTRRFVDHDEADLPPGTILPPAPGRWTLWRVVTTDTARIEHGDFGQRRLIVFIPKPLVFEAAADHCLAAAFAGACPGIDPEPDGAFWRYVVESRRQTFAPDLSTETFAAVFAASLATLRASLPAHDLCGPMSPELTAYHALEMSIPRGGMDLLSDKESGRLSDALESAYRALSSNEMERVACVPLSPQMVRDLTDLPVDGPIVAATCEQYPVAFQFGPLIGSVAGLGYIVHIVRWRREIDANGKWTGRWVDPVSAMRVGGCGEGTAAGPEPIRRWLNGVGEARGCLPATAAPPDNLYGVPARGFGGGTVRA